LSKKEQSVLKKFRNALEKSIGNNLVEMKLFGSKARGTSKKDSDIDVLVIIKNGDWHTSDVVYSIVTDIFLEDRVCISPKVINGRDYNYLQRCSTRFMRNIIREGILI